MDEKILIKKDSYLNIQKNESDGRVNVIITVEPAKNKFKPGDIVYCDKSIMIIDKYPNRIHCIAYPETDIVFAFNCLYKSSSESDFDFDCDGFRYATEEEKNTLFELLKKDGKRWNAEKLCVEDIHERKFKPGDKVRIKNGISSKTHMNVLPYFWAYQDYYIGCELTVLSYTLEGYVRVKEGGMLYDEDWLELVDELKVGDWVIAWSNDGKEVISKLMKISNMAGYSHPYLVCDMWFRHAVKWDKTFEQVEKVRKENETRRI